MNAPRTLASERGSIPLVLTVIIVVGGVVAALFSLTIGGTRQVRFDRDFNLAVNGAEAGLQQALSRVIQVTDPSVTTLDSSAVPADQLTVDSADFSWEATKDGFQTWQIRATGEVNGVERVLEAEAFRPARFFVAAFSDRGFLMRGNNEVDSYVPGNDDNGNGSVGSNNVIDILGNSSDVDLIYLFGPDARCDRGARCDDRPQAGFDEPFDMDSIRATIQQEMDAACSSFTSWTASSGPALVGGQTYCFTDMVFDRDTTLTGATSDNPVTVYMTGDLDTSNHTTINCTGCPYPDSGSLRIHSLGEYVSIGNHTSMAAAIEAPNANCEGSPSNAQADLYGALICNDLRNQGGWNFHFDERLLNLGSGEFEITSFREESTGTTSFD